MARGRGRKRRRKQLEPEEVLSGRIVPEVLELVRMIRRVNPTDRGLHPNEEERRYGQKTALQGTLISHFQDQLEVVAEDDDLVLLRHKPSGEDACHAKISGLEHGARRWVRFKLDEQQSPLVPLTAGDEDVGHQPTVLAADASVEPVAEGLDPDAGQLAPDELLGMGDASMAEYDYLAARQQYEAALVRSRGRLPAARALLDLLVNTLASYQEALGVAVQLSPDAARAAEVRVLLGLAAAHLGEADRAEDHVRGIADPEAAEVHLVLARKALGSEQADLANSRLEAARELAPAHHGVHALDKDLAALRARLLGPLEQEVKQALASGEIVEAEQLAKDLLEQWPDSEVAREALRQVRDARRRERSETLIQRADEAMAQERFGEAAALLEQAMAGGADEKVRASLEEARRRQREREDEAAVDAVIAALETGELRSGLALYLGLEPRLRAAVRQQNSSPHLGRLEESEARAPAAQRVDAILALSEAAVLLDAGAEAELIELLERHQQALQGVKDAGKLLGEANSRLLARRRSAALDGLKQAKDALARGEPDQARRHWDSVDVSALKQGEEQQARAVRTGIDEANDELESSRMLRQLQERGELFSARALARRRHDVTRGGTKARWRERLDEIQAGIRREWRYQSFDSPGDPAINVIEFRGSGGSTSDWLLPGGESIVLVSMEGQWVFLRVMDISTRRATRAASFRTPEPMGAPGTWSVSGSTIWIFGAAGWLLQIDCESLEILGWSCPRDLLPAEIKDMGLQVVRSGKYMWLTCPEASTSIVDLERQRVIRTLEKAPAITAITCAGEVGLFGQIGEKPARPYTERGTPLSGSTVRDDMSLVAATGHPGGDGFVILYIPAQQNATPSIRIGALSRSGHLVFSALLDGVSPRHQQSLACARRQGLVFHLATTPLPSKVLIAYRLDDERAEEIYRVPVSAATLLATDREGQWVAAVTAREGGVEIVPLDEDPRSLNRAKSVRDMEPLPQLDASYLGCGGAMFKTRPQARELAAELRTLPEADAESMVRRLRQEKVGEQEYLQDLTQAQMMAGEMVEQDGEHQWRHNPGHPGAMATHAHGLAVDGKWGEARRALDQLNFRGLGEPVARHLFHLHGLANYKAGDMEMAEAAWLEGAACAEGDCKIKPCVDLLCLEDQRHDEGGQGQDSPPVQQVIQAVIAADAARQGGDPGAALEHVDHPLIWFFREEQGLARLAEAYLHMEPRTAAELWKKGLVLAAFVQRHRPAYGTANLTPYEVPFPGHTWSSERFDTIADAASEWLEGDDR